MNFNNPKLIFKDIPTGKVGWRSPSNIALVKYWGKYGKQLPANPSISFTLSKSLTETTIEFSPALQNKPSLNFYFEGKENEKFGEKTQTFFTSIKNIFPFINQLDFKIHSKNTFPHSAGIASSASGMSAISLALCDIERLYFNTLQTEEDFLKKVSFVSRLGSGSACRSTFGGLVSWGKIEGLINSSDLYGSKLPGEINPVFNSYHDSILIVDSGQKKVSSTIGHGLMNSNPFSKERFKQANTNIVNLIEVIKAGDIERFVGIVESEALTLHSMMMTSSPYFLLMKPNTISIINSIWEFRKETGINACFTLDAGPNIHLLYPSENKNEVNDFIKSDLLKYTVNNTLIHDRIGNGPEKIV